MAAGGEQENAGCGGFGDGDDLYAVLGLKKECSPADLRSAYKKLALRWHPDRCSASGSSDTVEEAKKKFQAIQEAYSVLSDTTKRFLYDVGVGAGAFEDNAVADGMGEFLGEMAAMMRQSTNRSNPNESGCETFEQLQALFVEMFQADMDAFCGGGHGRDRPSTPASTSCCFSSYTPDTAAPSFGSYENPSGCVLKRDSADMCSGRAKGVAAAAAPDGAEPNGGFCFGTRSIRDGSSAPASGGGGKRRKGRKPKASSTSHGGGPSPRDDGELPPTPTATCHSYFY